MKHIKKEWVLVGAIILFYIFIRSLHFTEVFNFSSEQGAFATKALELFRSKKIELIGPPISWRYEDRYFFQGSLTYYAMMLFLILGSWDPVISSYLLVLFGAVMAVVLYIGTKFLINKKAAFILTFLFITLPFYIDYSRFFWNPTLQLLCTPFVILWMGLYKRFKKPLFLFLISFTSGVLMLFHYQYFMVIIGLTIYYLLQKKLDLQNISIFLLGFPIGFSPMIIFELRNHFYNLQTLMLFIQHANTVFPKGGTGILGIFTSYYMLSPLLFAIMFLLCKIKKISNFIIAIGAIGIIIWDFTLYLPKPKQAFGMAKSWNYLLELKAYNIMKSQNLNNFNVVNLGYDTVASVQKYFLIRDKVKGDWEDYYHNKYLFVITYPQDYMKNPAYEINTFTPHIVIKKWKLNEVYDMNLLKRS